MMRKGAVDPSVLLTPLWRRQQQRGVGWQLLSTPLAILVSTCLLCYINTLSCGFVFDDISAIKENKVKKYKNHKKQSR
jgi:hypothetical protein